jgi:hypothetical protein
MSYQQWSPFPLCIIPHHGGAGAHPPAALAMPRAASAAKVSSSATGHMGRGGLMATAVASASAAPVPPYL